jgi:RNA polymerase sigma factor (TIGR02999 family)
MDIPWNEIPDITLLIRQYQAGDRDAEGRLFGLAYPQLREAASRLLRRRDFGASACPLDLLHDVYLTRLRGWKGPVSDRSHFLALATLAMKNELVDRARRLKSQKRTAPESSPGFPQQIASSLSYEAILALEREVERLEAIDPRATLVLRLRYYGGCSWEETASATGASVKMVRNDWEFVSKWLAQRLGPGR